MWRQAKKPSEKRCSGCGKPPAENKPLSKCTKCLSAKYCSRECQKKHWKKHKKECARLGQARKEEADADCRQAATGSREPMVDNSFLGSYSRAKEEIGRQRMELPPSLPARAGRLPSPEGDPKPGFYVYWPRAKMCSMNAGDCQDFLRMGTEQQLRDILNDGETGWNALDGPGWPGVYTDARAEGLRLAPPAEVESLPSWEEAWGRWHELKGGADGVMSDKDFGLCFRTEVAAEVSPELLAQAIRQLLAQTGLGRDLALRDGVSLTGTHVVGDSPRFGFVVLSVQGNRSAAVLADNFCCASAGWTLKLKGQKLAFQLTHSTSVGEWCGMDGPAPLGQPPRHAQTKDPAVLPYSKMMEAISFAQPPCLEGTEFKAWFTYEPGVVYSGHYASG